jgi:RNA polymerase sigma-70 factor (ECF subfamily)
MTSELPSHLVFSVEEITKKLGTLSNSNAIRLKRIAGHYSKGRLSADDLLLTAFEKALTGVRTCPQHVDIMLFMKLAIRSEASNAFKALSRSPEVPDNSFTSDDEEIPIPIDHPSPEPTAEEMLVFDEQCNAIFALFHDDETAQLMVEGIMDKMTAQELQDLTGLDKTAYESKRRKIRRRIEQAQAKGSL